MPDQSIQHTASPSNLTSSTAPTISRPTKTTLADWTGGDDEDVNGFYGGEKRQRGGRKHKKKKQREEHVVVQDWDDIYDPTRPNNYEEYKNSDEKVREVREWKDRLYAHRMARKASSEKSSDEEDYRPQMNSNYSITLLSSIVLICAGQFAPPGMSFAPPPIGSPAKTAETTTENADSDSQRASIPPPPPPADLSPMPPPEPVAAGQISRAPVRYNLPPPPSDIPSSEAELEKALAEEEEEQPVESAEDAPRSLRPGQKGFAERLMSKYGWSKGKGLGADGSGIVNPLRVQVEKRKKKSDAEGGGFREPGGARRKIIGGKKNVHEKEKDPEEGKFGPMSEVIVLRGMVDGMDLEEEVGDGGLMQEIGDECGEKYGRVERVYIDRHGDAPKVFVKFTSQLSALRVSCLCLAHSKLPILTSQRLSTHWKDGISVGIPSLLYSMRQRGLSKVSITSLP